LNSRDWCIVCTNLDQYSCTLSDAIPVYVWDMRQRERGHAIPQIGEWWLRLARSLVLNDPRDLRTLGRDLAKHLERKQPFPHTTIGRFANKTSNPLTKQPYPVTYELVLALCAEYSRLPEPIFFPRSYEEAVSMHGVAERYDGIPVEEAPAEEAAVVALPKSDDRRRRGRSAAVSPVASTSSRAPRRARG
jgi:hypothetical protein